MEAGSGTLRVIRFSRPFLLAASETFLRANQRANTNCGGYRNAVTVSIIKYALYTILCTVLSNPRNFAKRFDVNFVILPLRNN